MFITKQAYKRLTDIEELSRAILAVYPVEIISNEMEYLTRCFYCQVEETQIPDYAEREERMAQWLNEHPQPAAPVMAVPRKQAPDMREWDRQRGKQVREYDKKYSAWNDEYLVAAREIWPEEPDTQRGMRLLHKEDCPYLRLKEVLS